MYFISSFDYTGDEMKITNKKLKNWVQKMATLCQPDRLVWLNGSNQEKRRLETEAVKSGELVKLNEKKWPGSFYHRSHFLDVARTESLTFICTKSQEEAGPTNNWMAPSQAYAKARPYFQGAMKKRAMYVLPFSMGLVNSPFAKIGVQLTDSLYVALNMRIMTHLGEAALKKLGPEGDFTKCLHSKANLDEKKRLILHFPEDNTIWSVGSGYGGNALLGKKCMALRIASFMGEKEGWMAEHMLIVGIEDPKGRITYLAAAFPSACGKTNLAMLIPPEIFRKKGYKIWTVGDDIAWLRIGKDGSLYAQNPETGIFGVVPGTNNKTNPHAVATMRKNTIFTNVLLTKDRSVWWEGVKGPAPQEGISWKGEPWRPGLTDEKGIPILGAHPNSRFTAPLIQCPSFSKHYFDTKGVPISALIFGARHASLSPLVYEARDWEHGVYVGASMSSERTAAQVGKLGEVRRDPMAMLPFCGYNMAAYFQHWLDIGKGLKKPPRIFHVNWFRKDPQGRFLWPGFGENIRVLLWMLDRLNNRVPAKEIPIGLIPNKTDMNLTGLNMSDEQWDALFQLNREEWLKDLNNQKEFFATFGRGLPEEILGQQEKLLQKLK